MVERIALAGGLFVVLAFAHFFVDWIFQSHKEAMAKSTNWKVRAVHCTVYTFGMFLPLMLMGLGPLFLFISLGVLWLSHFFIDTYVPVFLWAKYVRKMPGLSKETAKEIFSQPLNLILAIVVDQLFHLTFLWVPVILALSHWQWVYYDTF